MSGRPITTASSETLIRENALGRSLERIGEIHSMHPTSVSSRLSYLGVARADTRRAFMDDILDDLTPEQLSWLSNQLSSERTIKTYLRELIRNEFIRHKEKPSDPTV